MDEKEMSEIDAADICCGPINADTGVCHWCLKQHERTVQKEMDDGSMAELYETKCYEPWDRPSKLVIALFRETTVTEMLVECWFCKRETIANAILNPDLVVPVENGGTVKGICQTCGVFLDIKKASVVGIDEGRILLNRQQRRALQKGD